MNPEESKTEPAATKPAEANPEPPAPAPVAAKQGSPVKKIILVAVVALALVKGVPWAVHSFRTESTDDAYVNSYVTFVAPRIVGQVAKVLVEDNNRVKKGDILVQLDPEPFQVQVAIKEAAVESAKAGLVVAQATVRGQVAQARSQRF